MDQVSESRTGRKTETRYSAQNGNGDGVVNRRAKQRALAIGVIDGREHGEPLAELKELLRTAGVETVGMATQQRPKPDPDRYFGRGRLEELKTRSPPRTPTSSPSTTSCCRARSATWRRRSASPWSTAPR